MNTESKIMDMIGNLVQYAENWMRLQALYPGITIQDISELKEREQDKQDDDEPIYHPVDK